MDAAIHRGGAGAGGARARRIRVFLLDDHELMRRGLRGALEGDAAIEVCGESASAAEGVRRILALRPDVALLDVRLADGSGIEVCRAVRERDPGIRALMLTSYDDEAARTAALLAGASGFVLKEIRGLQLLEAVRRVAAGESLIERPAAGACGAAMSASDRVAEQAVASLTHQERRVLDLVVEGLTNGQIGTELGISEKTVRNHVTNVLAKLGFTRRTQAAVFMARRRD